MLHEARFAGRGSASGGQPCVKGWGGGGVQGGPSILFNYVVKVLDQLKPVYLHVIEGQTGGARDIDPDFDFAALRMKYHGTYMGNNGYTLALANKRIAEGAVDLVAFGKPFIANPDLVERFRLNASLNYLDTATLYGGGVKGLTDYPRLEDMGSSEQKTAYVDYSDCREGFLECN